MPGFHEEAEDNDDEIEELDPETFEATAGAYDDDADESHQSGAPLTKPAHRRPPHSTPNPQASGSGITLKRRNSEASAAKRIQVPESPPRAKPTIVENSPPPMQPQEGPQSHECPICGKTLQTDNQGLNAHIDFCLSRGAIMEAQVAASKPAAKPHSKSKGSSHTARKSSTKQGP